VYPGYSRTPTGKTQWGRSPASQLLMSGYLQDGFSITGRVYTVYSRTPTGKTHWGRSPASQLLMPGYLQNGNSTTGRAVGVSDDFCHMTMTM
jgi:hypothetical protein